MSEVNRVNITALKQYRRDFSNEKNNFNSSTYSTFSSSYIKRCSDPYVRRMSSTLQDLYDTIKKGYTNINTWWKDYNSNIESLEKSLSDNGSMSSIGNWSLRNLVNSNLSGLPDFNMSSTSIGSKGPVTSSAFGHDSTVRTLSNEYQNVTEGISNVEADLSGEAGCIWQEIDASWEQPKKWTSNIDEDTGSFVSKIKTVSKWAIGKLKDIAKNYIAVGLATLANGVIALTKGISYLIEALGDTLLILGAVAAFLSPSTFVVDEYNSVFNGKERLEEMKKMWADTKAVVTYNWTDKLYDSLYETRAGQVLDKYAAGFMKSDGTAFQILEGLGYVAGIVGLTLATFGTATPVALAGIATFAGAGKYTSEEWNKNSASVSYDGQNNIDINLDYQQYLQMQNLSVGQSMQVVQVLTDDKGNPIEVTYTFTAQGNGLYSVVDNLGNMAQFAGLKESDTIKGLVIGTIKSEWEGLQYYVGAKIGNAAFSKATGSIVNPVMQEKVKSAIRVGLDTLTGVAEVPFQALVTKWSEGISFKEAWDSVGGFKAVFSQATIAAIGSSAGEAFQFKSNVNTNKITRAIKSEDSEVLKNLLDTPEIKEIMLEMDDTFANKNFAEVLEKLISKEKNAQGKVAGSVLFDKLDYNSTPKLVGADEFDNLLQTSKGKVMFRGISGEDSLKYVEQFQTGDLYVGGGRGAIHGTGIYTAYGDTGLSVVQDYMSVGGTSTGGSIMKMLLDDDAKVIAYDVIEVEKEQILDAMAQRFRTFNDKIVDFNSLRDNLDSITSISDLNQAKYIVNTLNDTGYYAALRGYDAIDVPDKEFMVLLNRGKVTMVADSAVLLKEQFKTLNDVEISEMISTSKNQSEIFENLDPSRIENSKILSLEKQLFEEAEAKGMTLKELGSQKGGTSIDPQLQSQADQLANKVRQVAIDVEPKITADMRLLEGDNATLVGLDYRLKGQDSLSRKILSDSVKDGVSMDVAASKIGDSVRYTLLIDEASYVDQIQHNLDYLTEQGYTIKKFKNFWGGDIYQGVNTSIVSPDDVTFELQFHTKASFSTKESLNHLYYEIARNDFTSNTQKSLATKIMQINQSAVVVPEEILGYNYLLNVSELSSDAVSSLSSPQIRKVLLKMDDAQRYQMVNNLTDIQLERFALKSDGALADIVWLMDDNKFANFLSSVSNDSVALKNVLSLSPHDRIINSLKLISDDSVTKSIVDSFDTAQIRYVFSNADTDTLTRVIKYCTDENIASTMGYLNNPNTVLSLLDDKTFVNVVSKTDGLYLPQLVRNLNDTQLKVLLPSQIDANTYFRILQESNDFQLNDALSSGLIRNIEKKFKSISMTPRVKSLNSWADSIMTDNFRREFGGIINDTEFDKLRGTYEFLEEAAFKQKTGNSRVMAFNNGKFSTMNLGYSDEIVKANTSHETIHQLSYRGRIVQDNNGLEIEKAGVRIGIYDPSTNSYTAWYTGLNETFTEYLNELSLKQDYPVMGYCGYQPAVRRLKQILNLGIEGLNSDTIKKSYFANDLTPIRSIINLVTGDNLYFDSTFASAFDEAIGGNTHNLDKVVKMLMIKHILGG